MGESIACWYLRSQGLRVLARNVNVPGGELDIVARDGEELVAVEVRTTTGLFDPIDSVDDAKRARVERLGSLIGACRVDLVGIGLGDSGVDVHWLPVRIR